MQRITPSSSAIFAAFLPSSKDFSEGVKNFIASDLYSGEEIASRIISLGAVGEGGFDDSSILGEKLDSIAQSGGQLAAAAVASVPNLPRIIVCAEILSPQARLLDNIPGMIFHTSFSYTLEK